VDALASGASVRKDVGVQVPPRAQLGRPRNRTVPGPSWSPRADSGPDVRFLGSSWSGPGPWVRVLGAGARFESSTHGPFRALRVRIVRTRIPVSAPAPLSEPLGVAPVLVAHLPEDREQALRRGVAARRVGDIGADEGLAAR